MAVESTQTLREVRLAKYILGDKEGRWLVLTNLPLSYEDFLEIWKPQTPGTLRDSPGRYKHCFTHMSYIFHPSLLHHIRIHVSQVHKNIYVYTYVLTHISCQKE